MQTRGATIDRQAADVSNSIVFGNANLGAGPGWEPNRALP